MRYVLRTKSLIMTVEASNRFEAFKAFFLRLKKKPSLITDIGLIVTLKDEDGKEYFMRTVPLLFGIGLIDCETALLSLEKKGISLTLRKLTHLAMEDAERLDLRDHLNAQNLEGR